MTTETDYPKTLYKAGTGQGHMHEGVALKVGGKYLCDVQTVHNEDDHIAALGDGWHDSPEVACSPLAAEPAPKPEKTEKAA